MFYCCKCKECRKFIVANNYIVVTKYNSRRNDIWSMILFLCTVSSSLPYNCLVKPSVVNMMKSWMYLITFVTLPSTKYAIKLTKHYIIYCIVNLPSLPWQNNSFKKFFIQTKFQIWPWWFPWHMPRLHLLLGDLGWDFIAFSSFQLMIDDLAPCFNRPSFLN